MTPPAQPPSRRPRLLSWPRERLSAWFLSRLPLTDAWTLSQRTIYIVPTGGGWGFAAMLVVMLLASINYQLNLGFVLTFLLAGCAVVSMHLTHRTLSGLRLHLRPLTPVFAGEGARVDVVLQNTRGQRDSVGVAFNDDDGSGRALVWTDVPAQGEATAQLVMTPVHRGWHRVPTVRVHTRFPFGLFQAWSLWRPAAQLLVYPRPEHPAPALPLVQATGTGAMAAQGGVGDEFDGVRAWRRGDALRQVLWKKVARVGELVSRETSSTRSTELWLDWHAARPPSGQLEDRLSRLTAWVLQADRLSQPYGLRLPGTPTGLGWGEAHRRHLLERLALWT